MVSEPAWIGLREALAIHERSLALFGGGPGIRDQALLESALARPQQHRHYAGTNDIVRLAALYTLGIVRNHPFVDGNKRTGFLIGALFLELNGWCFDAPEEEAAQAVLDAAAGLINEDGYELFLGRYATRADSLRS
jgi:death on curing protein